jgi:hypothetical protein
MIPPENLGMKGGENMSYLKPEVISLGPATDLIHGNKMSSIESISPFQNLTPADSELDD